MADRTGNQLLKVSYTSKDLTPSPSDAGGSACEAWVGEVTAAHRWGRFRLWFDEEHPQAEQDLTRLRALRQAAGPFIEPVERLIEQIRSLEICNWRLEDGIIELCRAIGATEPTPAGVGHLASMTPERWCTTWSYYLSLRTWLHGAETGSHGALLERADPKRTVAGHVVRLLGQPDAVKRAYVERLCLALERWLGDYQPGSAAMKSHVAAVATCDEELSRLDPGHEVLHEDALKDDGDGRLNPCNHKLLYRYDLIISSIGVGKWRGAMGRRGTDGLDRADLLEQYLVPIGAWLDGATPPPGDISQRVSRLLGPREDVRVFLAALLLSLLRSQQLAARRLAESRAAPQG